MQCLASNKCCCNAGTRSDKNGMGSKRAVDVWTEVATIDEQLIDDFAFGASFFGGEFDGDLDIPNAVQGTYSILLSDYIQKVVDGEEDPIIFLQAFSKIDNTRRSILYGSGSIDYAPELELTFTRINQ